MPQRLTRNQARAYMAQWRAVRAAQLQELRAMSAVLKFRQVAALMASARALGWSAEAGVPETNPAREQWRRLRQAYGVGD